MKCPVCTDVRMREVEKDGVMIDVCPDCKGVWLDRGELEKLMQGMRQMQDDYDRMERQYYDEDSRRQQQPRTDMPPSGNYAPYNGGHDQRGPDQRGYDQRGYDNKQYDNKQYDNKHYDNKNYGYDKYGRPKKKKSMFEVFGDLFD